MAVTLDSTLNTVIPIVVFIFLGWILYKPFAEPIKSFLSTIKGWFEGRASQETEVNVTKSINYE